MIVLVFKNTQIKSSHVEEEKTCCWVSDHVTCSQLLLLFTAKTSDDYTLKETFTFNEMPFFNVFFFLPCRFESIGSAGLFLIKSNYTGKKITNMVFVKFSFPTSGHLFHAR